MYRLPTRPDRRRLLLAAAALPACAAPPRESAPPGAARWTPPRTGQRWRYAEINRYNGQLRAEVVAQVVESEPSGLRIALSSSGPRKRDDEIYADPTHIVQESAYDYTQVFEQPVAVLPEPLAAGASTSLRTRYRTPVNDDRLAWGDWLVARGWQRVQVPAGEFLALRVDRLIHFRHVDLWREDCTRYDYAWYVPEVGRWVRREWTGRYLMPSGPDRAPAYEDWVVWELLDWQPA